MPLPGLVGGQAPVRAAGAPLLVCIGHSECATSALTLSFLDRMHRRGGRALAVLQDDEGEARAVVDELGLALPVRRDGEPYALAEALELVGVPVLYLLDGESRVRRVSEGFVRAEMEELAGALGVPGPLIGPEEAVPSRRPG